MKYLGHFFVSLLLIGTCLLTQSLIAEDIVQVKSVQGRVIIRAPLSQDWVAVKKAQKLKVGWILQLMDGAAIELSLRGDMLQNSKSQAKELVVAIKVPLIIRIGSEMVRQTERVNIYLDELPVATGGPQIYSWQNAFTRINAALSPKYKLNAKSSSDDLQRQRQDIEVLENKSQIKLIQPSAVDLVLGTVPMRYTLRWSQSEQNLMEADPKTKFLVYIWKEDEERGEAFAKVNRLSPYTITLKSYGNYYVQLESEDGKASSTAHIIQVKPLLAGQPLTEVSPSSALGKKRPNGPPLFLRYPKPDMSFVLSGNQSKIPFAWQVDQGYQARQWVLFDHEQKLLKSVELQKGQHGLLETLEAGSYTWMIVYSKEESIDTYTVESNFAIEGLGQGVYSSLDLNGSWQKKTIFLDGGL